MRSLLLILLIVSSIFCNGQQAVMDSLQQSVQLNVDTANYKQAFLIKRKIGRILEDQRLLDSANAHYHGIIDFVEKYFQDTVAINLKGDIYVDLGFVESARFDFEQALLYADTARELYESIGDEYSVALALSNIGGYLIQTGDLEGALDAELKTLEIAETLTEEEKKNQMMAAAYLTISKIYMQLEEYDKMIDFAKKSAALSSGYEKAKAVFNVGAGYHLKFQSDSAYYYTAIADSIFMKMGDPFMIYQTKINLTQILIDQGKYQEALEEANYIEDLSTQYDDAEGMYFATISKGEILFMQNYPQKALLQFTRALEFANQLDNPNHVAAVYKNLSFANSEIGNYREAFEYHEKFHELDSTVNASERIEGMNELMTKYETEQKERRIVEQELELSTQQSEIKSQRIQIITLVSGLIIVILFALIYYNQFRNRQKQALQAAVIDEQERGLEAVFNATEEERKRIAKDLHDGVGQQLSALKRGFEDVVKLNIPEEAKTKTSQLKKLLDETADETRSISHQMMPRALMELGLVPAISDSLNKSLGTASIEFEFEHFNLKERYDERKEVAVYRILQELINNIIKHSGAKTVNVQLFESNAHLILVVEDDGRWITNEQSDGIGILNIKNRLNTFKGRVNLEPSLESGTIATISIPV